MTLIISGENYYLNKILYGKHNIKEMFIFMSINTEAYSDISLARNIRYIPDKEKTFTNLVESFEYYCQKNNYSFMKLYYLWYIKHKSFWDSFYLTELERIKKENVARNKRKHSC